MARNYAGYYAYEASAADAASLMTALRDMMMKMISADDDERHALAG